MNNLTESVFTSATVLTAIFIGASVLLLVYICKLFRNQETAPEKPLKHEKHTNQSEKKKDLHHSGGKSKKKIPDSRWSSRSEKQAFSHPWLLTTLKGHTGEILDVDFSSNGKYLSSCADEDPDPGGEITGSSSSISNSSGSECNKENSPPSSEPSPRTKGLSRRQRKNRRREDSSPTQEQKKKSRRKNKKNTSNTKKHTMEVPLKNYVKLNLSNYQLQVLLSSYVLEEHHMIELGYPFRHHYSPHQVLIWKGPQLFGEDYQFVPKKLDKFDFNINAREFVPKNWRSRGSVSSGNSSDAEGSTTSNSSGGSPVLPVQMRVNRKLVQPPQIMMEQVFLQNIPTMVFETSNGKVTEIRYATIVKEVAREFVNPPTYPQINFADPKKPLVDFGPLPKAHSSSSLGVKRVCVRCRTHFYPETSRYAPGATCYFHYGKLERRTQEGSKYNCCGASISVGVGCSFHDCHVWNGVVNGMNIPRPDFVQTQPSKKKPADGYYGIYALDCEMCYTRDGLELVKVTVVHVDGSLAYESYVSPTSEIVDFNTKFSGIDPLVYYSLTHNTLREVQRDLMAFISSESILIGHGLENDLRALRMVHYRCIDTAICFPHNRGLPFRRSLKSLYLMHMNGHIQVGEGKTGHDSHEDACACLELMLCRLRTDMLEQEIEKDKILNQLN